MAYIAPDSDIEFCRGFPLDRGHEYAIYFASASAQYSAIHAYASKIYDKNSYQRVNKRTIRVGELADNLQGVNYMAFRNTAFGTKWFYAFVDEVNYINNSVCEVVYTIDPLQTYLFDFNWNACLVEREHTLTDNLGEHTETENISEPTRNYRSLASRIFKPDEWIYRVISSKDLSINPTAAAGYTKASQWPNATPAIYNGVLQGCGLYTFIALTDLKNIAGYLDDLGIGNAIVGISSVCPTDENLHFSSTLTGNFDGYSPKNKKLYTSPFCKIVLSSMGVSCKELDVQGFTISAAGVDGNIRIQMSDNPNASMFAYPVTYRGTGGATTIPPAQDTVYSREYGIKIGDAIQGSWSSDAYENWLAQTGQDLALNAIISGVAAAGSLAAAVATEGALAPLAAGMVTGAISNGLQTARTMEKAKNLPNNIIGGAASGSENLAFTAFGVNVLFAYPVAEQAKRIDDYFTMYGYACNKIKVPSINNRPYWTYCKTNGCAFTPKIGSGIPAPDMEAINGYFDRGITWFKTAADVGRFDRDNSPV